MLEWLNKQPWLSWGLVSLNLGVPGESESQEWGWTRHGDLEWWVDVHLSYSVSAIMLALCDSESAGSQGSEGHPRPRSLPRSGQLLRGLAEHCWLQPVLAARIFSSRLCTRTTQSLALSQSLSHCCFIPFFSYNVAGRIYLLELSGIFLWNVPTPNPILGFWVFPFPGDRL